MTTRTARGRMMNRNRAKVFSAVMWHWIRNGCAPTTTEICMATGLRSKSTVNGHLRALQADGLIDWDPETQGTIRPSVRVVAV